MDSGFIEDFVTICEGKFKPDEINTLQEGLSKPDSPRQPQETGAQRPGQEQGEPHPQYSALTLDLITRVVQRQEKEEKNKAPKAQHPLLLPHNPSTGGLSSKEETEAVMEGLMNRIVANPNLIVDETLNSRIENIFNCNAFQKMVEHADVYPEGLSNASGISHDGSGLNLTVSRSDPGRTAPQGRGLRGGGAFTG